MSEKQSPRASQGGSSLDAEIQAALGDASLMDLADPSSGESEGHRKGTVVDVGDKDVLVEFNAREQGTCPIDQFAKPPVVGETHPFKVVRHDKRSGLLVLTLGRHASSHADWADLQLGGIVKAKITGHNSGGLEAKVAGHRAFIPFSQVALERVEDGSQFVDQAFECKVIELDRSREKLVLSRRAVLELEREEQKRQAVDALVPGARLPGKVTRIEQYGAFVDVGGVEGLLHVSQMDYQRVNDPNEYVELGQEIEVEVLKIEEGGSRISLGIKQLKPDPWDDFLAFNEVGSIVPGKVTRIENYGAFMELAPGLEGLCHISQLSPARVDRVRSIVTEGQTVDVRIANIDRDQRRIGLSRLTLRGNILGDDSEVDDDTIAKYTTSDSADHSGSSLGDLLKAAMEKKG